MEVQSQGIRQHNTRQQANLAAADVLERSGPAAQAGVLVLLEHRDGDQALARLVVKQRSYDLKGGGRQRNVCVQSGEKRRIIVNDSSPQSFQLDVAITGSLALVEQEKQTDSRLPAATRATKTATSDTSPGEMLRKHKRLSVDRRKAAQTPEWVRANIKSPAAVTSVMRDRRFRNGSLSLALWGSCVSSSPAPMG